jgi:hypothetical protein
MRKRSLAVAPALPTAALAISHSSVEPARKNTEVEALPKPEPLETKSEEELVLLRKIVSKAKVFRRPSAKTGATSGCKVAANVRNGDQHGPRWVVSQRSRKTLADLLEIAPATLSEADL